MNWTIKTQSSYQLSFFSRQNIARATSELQSAGQEVATGKRADIYSYLGSRSTAVMQLRASEADSDSFMQANDVLGNKLQAMLTASDAARNRLQSVLETALSNATETTNGAEVLQLDARAALESIVATLNSSYNGDFLFSGLKSDVSPLLRWNEVNAATGYSPEDAITSIFGSGPTDAASAIAIADQIDAVFASSDPIDANRNYEATFYRGSAEIDGGGQPTRQVNAWVTTGQEVIYGVRANDEPFREAIKGLAMLAVTDVSQMDKDAYSSWMNRVIGSLSNAQDGILKVSARIGFSQEIVEKAQLQLTDLSLVRRTQINSYESVDPYEAVTRMTSLETQLQASYEVSSRLNGLTILNFLR